MKNLWTKATSIPITTELNVRSILNRIQRIITPDESIDIEQTTFNIPVINMPRGSGNCKRIPNFAEGKILNDL